ncbi:MAG TPA: hypothetical protein VGF69_17695 [Thermoanaerobaculia bacterium]|jgi:hypothetical protein
MRFTLVLLLLLPLMAGCASNDGFIEEETIDASAGGSDVTIELVGLEKPLPTASELTFLVEVSNNSDADITVTKVVVRPFGNDSVFVIDRAQVGPNEVIEEGKAEVFRVRTRGEERRRMRDNERPTAVVSVSVSLLGGATYESQFAVEVPVQRF